MDFLAPTPRGTKSRKAHDSLTPHKETLAGGKPFQEENLSGFSESREETEDRAKMQSSDNGSSPGVNRNRTQSFAHDGHVTACPGAKANPDEKEKALKER